MGSATSNGSGVYSISLPQGSYKLYIQPDEAGYSRPVARWHRLQQRDHGRGQRQHHRGPQPHADTRRAITLSGTVSTSGGPLAGATVHVFTDGTAYSWLGATTSTAGGAYSITLPPGSYKLYIQPNNGGYPDQWHGGPDYAGATTVTLNANATEDISLTPTPPATFTLSGTVSTSAGSLAGATVHVFDGTAYAWVGSTTSTAGGAYTINLPQGTYKLYIQPNSAGYPDQWHGGPDYAGATVITLNANTTEDISLSGSPPPATFTLSGTVTGAAGAPIVGAAVHVFDGTAYAYVANTTSTAGGAYTIDLPQGTYKLFIQPNTAGYPDQWHGGPTTPAPASSPSTPTRPRTSASAAPPNTVTPRSGTSAGAIR